MFEGYLEYGGIEVVNSRRVSDLALADGVAWIMGPTYPELEHSISTESGFDLSDPTQAPWYDANQADLSTRFYGVYGLSVKNAYDSVESTPVTQNAGNGGVLGASRKGTKSIVVSATLLALGADAMEFGRAWLQSVLDLDNCGQDEDCSRADVLFFSANPANATDALAKARYLKYSGTTSGPFAVNEYASRGVYNTDVEWTWTSEKPYVYGPQRDVTLSIATALALIQDSPINWIPYPSAELAFTQPIYTNIVTNPSLEATAGLLQLTALTNLSINPSAETGVTNDTAIPGTTGVAAVTSAAPATTTAYGTKVAKTTWSTASTAVGGGMSHLVPGITAGQTYSFAFKHVKTSIANTLQFSVDWLNNASALISNSPGNTIACAAGAINTTFQLVNVVAPALATQALLKVISTGAGVVNSIGSFIEVDGVMALNTGFMPAYYDGASAQTTDAGYAWSGTANGSTSTVFTLACTSEYTFSAGASASALLYNSGINAFAGGRSGLMEWTVASSTVRGGLLLGNAGSGPAVVAGQVYQALGYVLCSKAQLMALEIQFYDASNTAIGIATVGSSVLLVSNTWTQLSVSVTAPVGAARVKLFFTSETGTGGVNWAAGDTLQLDAVSIVAAAAPVNYFDGDLAYPAGDYALTWTGTAEASASTQQVVPIIARNANPNPGLELNTTGWAAVKAVVSGTDPAARFSGAQGTLACALGTHNYVAAILGTGTGIVASSVTTMTITDTVQLASIPSTKLVQLSIWAATAVLAGTVSAFGALTVSAKFFNVSNAQVGATATLTADPRGLGVYSSAKLAIPATATYVVISVAANATWSDGTTDAATSDLRIYADAATVAYFGGI